MELGSEFWLNKSQIYNRDCEVPIWLKKFGSIILTSSGRGAISLFLEQVDVRIKRALLPSYICDSVITPFEEAGYELIYYDVDKHFIPKNIEIENAEIGIFLHMGYFGFPTNAVLLDIISKLRSNSVVIIEDVTHTLFSDYQRLIDNDYVVGSIRKWFGIPSGGFLASNNKLDKELVSPPNEFINLRIMSLLQKYEYMKKKNRFLKDSYLEGFRKAEQILDEDVGSYIIDSTSKTIIHNIDIQGIKNSRKQNFEFLLKNLSEINGIEIIFNNVENNITPMFFPIYIKHDRDKLRFDLIKEEIYCPIHWPIPKQMQDQLDRKTENIYKSILSIPCDQRYSVDDMHRVVKAINDLI